jgi:hypothetical protein
MYVTKEKITTGNSLMEMTSLRNLTKEMIYSPIIKHVIKE